MEPNLPDSSVTRYDYDSAANKIVPVIIFGIVGIVLIVLAFVPNTPVLNRIAFVVGAFVFWGGAVVSHIYYQNAWVEVTNDKIFVSNMFGKVQTYENRNIVYVSHQIPAMLSAGQKEQEYIEVKFADGSFIQFQTNILGFDGLVADIMAVTPESATIRQPGM